MEGGFFVFYLCHMRLHFERLGEGNPTYLFLHGFLGSGDNWRTIAKSLSLPGSAYLIDLRNHGRSPHASTHRYPEIVADVLELLDAEGIPKAHWLGHSMGGKAAMYAALHFPERVASLVVGDIAPRAYKGGHEAILSALQSVSLDATRREAIEAQLAQKIPDPSIRLFLLKNLARDAEGRFFWRLNLPVLIREYPHILVEIEGKPYLGPTLFLRGELSSYIALPQDEISIRRLFPAASIYTVPRAGHWIHVDNPETIRQILRNFWGIE